MMLYEFEAVAYNGEVYCSECCPIDINDASVTPIFASDEVDEVQICCECGCEHDYMNIRVQDESNILEVLEQENLKEDDQYESTR